MTNVKRAKDNTSGPPSKQPTSVDNLAIDAEPTTYIALKTKYKNASKSH